MAETYLYIDASELTGLLEIMASKLTPEQFDTLMRRSLNEVGKRSKKIIREAIQMEYYAKTNWVNESIKGARIEGGVGNILCRIPIVSQKGTIGGHFSAGGSWYGGYPPPYRITAQIVKGEESVLPPALPHQGGQPPFRNIGERKMSMKNPKKPLKKPKVVITTKAGMIAFTRTGKSRYPIEPVSGIAVPQMPLTRSRGVTENRIMALAEKRVIHNFSHLFG